MAAEYPSTQCSRFKGKVAFVTGAADERGIGAAVAHRLAAEGASVAIFDVKPADAVVSAIGSGRCVSFEGNVADEAAVQGALSATVSTFGRLDVLVNNAAVFVFADAASVTEDDWDRVLSINVKGYSFCIKHASAHMRRGGGGSIVNLASISSVLAQPGFVPYSTSKGAILQLSKCAALDLAGDGIRVNAVCPGPVATRATMRHAASQGKTKEEVSAEMAGRVMLGRMGRPEEVAACVAFLASDEASYVTGTHLLVDGGYTGM